jgi:hypothetical protein
MNNKTIKIKKKTKRIEQAMCDTLEESKKRRHRGKEERKP